MLELEKESHNLAAKMSSILNATTASLAAAATTVTTMGGSDNNKHNNNNDDAAADDDDAGKYARTHTQTQTHTDTQTQSVANSLTEVNSHTDKHRELLQGCRTNCTKCQCQRDGAKSRNTQKTRHVAAESVRK